MILATANIECKLPTADILLIVGTSLRVWEDVDMWSSFAQTYHVMTISDMGAYYPYRMDHWASLHSRLLPAIKVLRRARNNGDFISHTIEGQEKNGVDIIWNVSKLCGSSSMFASIVGIKLSYKKVVLAGCPLDCSGHFYSPPSIKTHFGNSASLKSCWTMMKKEVPLDNVRSMSGWSMELLGYPTEEWLNENL